MRILTFHPGLHKVPFGDCGKRLGRLRTDQWARGAQVEPMVNSGSGGTVSAMVRFLSILSVLGWALSLTGCAAFEFQSQELRMRHDAENDSLDFTLLYLNVEASRDSSGSGLLSPSEGQGRPDQESSVDVIEAMASGRRYFVVYDWPWVFDLDSTDIDEAVDDPVLEALRLAWKEVVDGVHVRRSMLFVDETGELGMFQAVSLEEASRRIGVLNAAVGTYLASEHESVRGLIQDEAGLSPETLERWKERGRQGQPWFVLAGGGFELRVPLSAEELARVIEALVSESAENPKIASGFVAPLAKAMTSLTHQDGLLTARFLPADGGWLNFRFERPAPSTKGRLLTGLREREVPIPTMDVEAARTLIRETE